jgi:hypothetical protein
MCYYFLRIEVTKLSDGVIRTQGKYVLDLLKGLFGTALLQLLQLCSQTSLPNRSTSRNSTPQKKMELRANSMFFSKLLRGYSRNQQFVCPRGVEG